MLSCVKALISSVVSYGLCVKFSVSTMYTLDGGRVFDPSVDEDTVGSCSWVIAGGGGGGETSETSSILTSLSSTSSSARTFCNVMRLWPMTTMRNLT